MSGGIELTPHLAWCGAVDAANRQMRKAGRKAWSVEDYNLAVEHQAKFLRCLPEPYPTIANGMTNPALAAGSEERLMTDQNHGNTIDPYDRLYGALDGIPDAIRTRPSTVRTTVPLIGSVQTWIVQTVRRRDRSADDETPSRSEDTIFLEVVSSAGSQRIAIPPDVANTIARQRDALTAKARSRAARAKAQDRKDRGEVLFLRKAEAK
jgi:hypothetical protein